MGTKPQRRQRITKEQRRKEGSAMAQAVTAMVDARASVFEARVLAERRRNRVHAALLWVAVVLGAVLGVWL